jgi:hypothetical protein
MISLTESPRRCRQESCRLEPPPAKACGCGLADVKHHGDIVGARKWHVFPAYVVDWMGFVLFLVCLTFVLPNIPEMPWPLSSSRLLINIRVGIGGETLSRPFTLRKSLSPTPSTPLLFLFFLSNALFM